MNVREWALPVYTILMQLSVGALLVLWVIRLAARKRFSPEDMDRITRNPLLVISFTVMVAMLASHFHLSKPLHSFYAVRNFRTSWLSREVLFTIFFFLSIFTLGMISYYRKRGYRFITIWGWVSVLLGLGLVYCMARIYMIPSQSAWNSSAVIISFYSTTLLLGPMTIACLLVLDLKFAEIRGEDHIDVRVQVITSFMGWLISMIVLAMIVNMVVMFHEIRFLGQRDAVSQASAQLLLTLYFPLFVIRLLCPLAALFWIGYAIYRMNRDGSTPQGLMTLAYMSCLLILVGEIIGRFLFYATHIRIGI